MRNARFSAPLDAIFLNAGCTHPRAEWIAALSAQRSPGHSADGDDTRDSRRLRGGRDVKVTRKTAADVFDAEVVSRVGIYDCVGARGPG